MLSKDYPMEEVLSGAYLFDEYNPDLIQSVLEKLTPDTVRLNIVGKKFEDKTDQKEKWYGTDYSICRLSEDVLQVIPPLYRFLFEVKVILHGVRMKSSTQQKVSQLVQNCKYLPEILTSTTGTIFTRDPKAV